MITLRKSRPSSGAELVSRGMSPYSAPPAVRAQGTVAHHHASAPAPAHQHVHLHDNRRTTYNLFVHGPVPCCRPEVMTAQRKARAGGLMLAGGLGAFTLGGLAMFAGPVLFTALTAVQACAVVCGARMLQREGSQACGHH